MALESGATAIVAERGQEGIAKVREISVAERTQHLKCVGTEAAVEQALGVLHNGGRMGFVEFHTIIIVPLAQPLVKIQ